MRKFKPFFHIFILTAFLFSGLIAKSQTTVDTTIHAIAQQKPEYPGGAHARVNFLASHLQYPENALRNKVSGKVYVGFVVEQDGSISHVKVLKGIGHGCDKEAMQVVAQMPKWKPGLINGKPVRVRFTLPFAFNIHAPDKERVYSRVDVYPSFDVDTISGIEDFIQRYLHYPVGILKDSVTDTVTVYFVVKPNDSITHVSVRKDTAQLDAYDYEAMRVVRNLPVSAPAFLHNQPVSLQLYIPVVFDYKQINPSSSKVFHTTFNGKTFSYYRPGMAVVPDKMPSFPGGIRALMQYLTENIRYPEEAKKMHLQGRVFLQFIVEADGSITHIRVIRGVSPSLDAEAVRVIRNMPKWKPGTQRGKPVRVRFNLPIKFTMQ
jgi:TonB family protein